jgi:pantoate--beta-alanine ligase
VRESDGLALSSRNVYLTAEQRRIAPALHRVLAEAVAQIARGASPQDAAAEASAALLQAGFEKVDYLTCVDGDTLQPLVDRTRSGRVAAAAWLGKTRLIDNEPVPPRGAR